MAKVYYYYSAMNAGKTTLLLQARYNYEERGLRTICLKPAVDIREHAGSIVSRVGLSAPCTMLGKDESLYRVICEMQKSTRPVSCVLIDESQFLTASQAEEVFDVCDILNIPVLCFGLRSDFLGRPFPASSILLAKSDKLVELKAVCHCGSKATMNMRVDAQGNAVNSGEQILVGGNDTYVSVCRRHFSERLSRIPSTGQS
jgi:thymidine kinase